MPFFSGSGPQQPTGSTATASEQSPKDCVLCNVFDKGWCKAEFEVCMALHATFLHDCQQHVANPPRLLQYLNIPLQHRTRNTCCSNFSRARDLHHDIVLELFHPSNWYYDVQSCLV